MHRVDKEGGTIPRSFITRADGRRKGHDASPVYLSHRPMTCLTGPIKGLEIWLSRLVTSSTEALSCPLDGVGIMYSHLRGDQCRRPTAHTASTTNGRSRSLGPAQGGRVAVLLEPAEARSSKKKSKKNTTAAASQRGGQHGSDMLVRVACQQWSQGCGTGAWRRCKAPSQEGEIGQSPVTVASLWLLCMYKLDTANLGSHLIHHLVQAVRRWARLAD